MDNTPQNVQMTRAEAESLMHDINITRKGIVSEIRVIGRMRSMLPENKQASIATLSARLERFVALQEKIGTIFHLGGY